MTTQNMPVLALRGLTAFPGQTLSFDAEREISILALENAMEGDRELLLVTQREIGVRPPGRKEDLYERHRVPHFPDRQDLGYRGTGHRRGLHRRAPCAPPGRPSPSCRPMELHQSWRPRTAPEALGPADTYALLLWPVMSWWGNSSGPAGGSCWTHTHIRGPRFAGGHHRRQHPGIQIAARVLQ